MKIADLKPGQDVTISEKKYKYEGIKKVRGVIGIVQKIVFQGQNEQKILYPLTAGTRTLESENIIIEPINEDPDLEECIGCSEKFNYEKMEQDDAGENYCQECWKEMSTVMQAEYDELVSKGEIE